MLNWILDPSHIQGLLWALAAATPAGAALALPLWRGRPGTPLPKRRGYWLAALAGPIVLALWHIYNAIEDRFGLDSLAALGLNALIFLSLGVGIGIWLRNAPPQENAE